MTRAARCAAGSGGLEALLEMRVVAQRLVDAGEFLAVDEGYADLVG